MSTEGHVINAVVGAAGLLSAMGSTFTIVMYARYPDLRSLSYRIIMWIGVCDLLFTLSQWAAMLANPRHWDHEYTSATCTAEAVFAQFLNLASILWTVVISVLLHTSITDQVLGLTSSTIEGHLPVLHAAVWGTSALLTILPGITDSYGWADGWCWITDRGLGTFWRFFTFYFPLALAFAYILYINSRLRAQILLWRASATEDSAQIQTLTRLRLYPLAVLVAWFWAYVNRIYQVWGPAVFWMALLHVLFSTLQGFFNALIYGYSPRVRAKLFPSIEGMPLTQE